MATAPIAPFLGLSYDDNWGVTRTWNAGGDSKSADAYIQPISLPRIIELRKVVGDVGNTPESEQPLTWGAWLKIIEL